MAGACWGGALVSHWLLPRLADWRGAYGCRADWLGPEVRLWGDARRPAKRRDTDKELPKGCPEAARAPPRALRAGAAPEGGGGAAALGALLGGGNASLPRRSQTPAPSPPGRPLQLALGHAARRGAEPVSRSPRARQPMGGPGERGQHAGPACPRGAGCQSPVSHSPGPAPARLPRPAMGEGGLSALLCHRAPHSHRAPGRTGAGERAAAAAASSQGWNGSPGAPAPQFVPPPPSPGGPAPSGCPRCGLCSRRPPLWGTRGGAGLAAARRLYLA